MTYFLNGAEIWATPFVDNSSFTGLASPDLAEHFTDADITALEIDPVDTGGPALGTARFDNYLVTQDDLTAPVLTDEQFIYEDRQAIQFTFDEDVGASLDVEDLVLLNVTQSQFIPNDRFTLEVSPDGTTGTWVYDVATYGPLPDGNYVATISQNDVEDAAGNNLSGDVVFEFFFVNADATRDRVVNVADFAVMRAHFGQTGRPFSEGDFNYDDIVNVSDFAILRANFGTYIPPPAGRGLFAGGTSGGGAGEDGGEDLLA